MTPRLEWNARFSKPGKNRVKYKSQKLSQKRSGKKQEKFEGCKKHALLDKLRDGVESQQKVGWRTIYCTTLMAGDYQITHLFNLQLQFYHCITIKDHFQNSPIVTVVFRKPLFFCLSLPFLYIEELLIGLINAFVPLLTLLYILY